MNMKNKYYTPELEEFHIGFEYEHKGTGLRATDTGEWKFVIYEMSDHTRAFKTLLGSGHYRVKYLDKKDIWDLGFKTDYRVEEGSWQSYNKGDYGLEYDPDYNTVVVYKLEDHDIFNSIFTGSIKNKSELKKLLKQLGLWDKDSTKQ